MQLRECSGESVRKGDRQDVDAGGTPCITWPVRRFSASAAVRAVVPAEDLKLVIHPHPTLSESVGMAAEVYEGVCTDLPPQRKK